MKKVTLIILMAIGLIAGSDATAQQSGYEVFVPIAKYISKGDVNRLSAWFADNKNKEVLARLLQEVRPAKRAGLSAASQGSAASSDPASSGGGSAGPGQGADQNQIAGKTFVVTGKVEHFPNRDALKEYIADRGGKVTGSVSAKTDYLINNDISSSSSKNKGYRSKFDHLIWEKENGKKYLYAA